MLLLKRFVHDIQEWLLAGFTQAAAGVSEARRHIERKPAQMNLSPTAHEKSQEHRGGIPGIF